MDKTMSLASDTLLGIGGEDNILRLENCMTCVRVEVQGDRQTDIPRLRQPPGASGYAKQGVQHQIIVGPGKAAKVVDATRSLIADGGERAGANNIERTKSEAKVKYKASMGDALRKLASVFIPPIPAFIASGSITGIINILRCLDTVGDFATHYPSMLGLTGIFGSAVFVVMSILAEVNTAKVFGGSPAVGGVMAGILSSPQLAQITLFGEVLQPGRGGVIVVLLVVAPMCWIERKFRTSLLESLELILNPLLTTITTGVIAIAALQPLGGWISEPIAHGVSWAIDRGGSLAGAALTGTLLPLVLTGLHQGLVSIHAELVQAHGHNALLPILAMAGAGQTGAAIVVLTKTCNVQLEKVIKGVLPVGLLGTGESLIFGVALPLGKPFIGVCFGGMVGGTLTSYWKVATVITSGTSELPLALTIIAGKVIFYLLGYLVAVIAGFLFTWLLGSTDPEE